MLILNFSAFQLFGHRDLSTVIDHKHARPVEVRHL